MHKLFVAALSLLLTSQLSFASPTSLDADSLRKNGEQAQQLNGQYSSIRAADKCDSTNDGQACVEGLIATCVNGTWSSSKDGNCTSKGQQCFAVPSVRSPGVNLICTSQKNAESIIASCGGGGGGGGSGGANSGSSSGEGSGTSGSGGSGSGPPYSPGQAPNTPGGTVAPPLGPAPTTPSAPSPNAITVTVTVTQTPPPAACQPTIPTIPGPGTTITSSLPPITQTLSPDQASSILSSLSASPDRIATSPSAGAPPYVTGGSPSPISTSPPAIIVPGTTTSIPPVVVVTSSPAIDTSTPSTTILLTPAPAGPTYASGGQSSGQQAGSGGGYQNGY